MTLLCVMEWIKEGKEQEKHLYVSVNEGNLDNPYDVDSEEIVDNTNTYVISRNLKNL